jgi:tRNA pseudouridine32 synthase
MQTYYTWAKERWHHKTLLEVFCSEFRDRTPEYYHAAIARGSVNVNGQVVDEKYKIQNGDCISHAIHRHEPPVSSRPVKIIHHDNESGLVVIDKPAGIPVHAAGRYHQNSIVTILRLEHGFTDISPCNRLDRLTSGVMMLGLNKNIASQIHAQLSQRSVFKEYYCRVTGLFPEGELTVDNPIATISPKHGLNRLKKDGKPSKTVFKRFLYDEKRDQSVVIAKPLTGRTHQIRYALRSHPR